MKGPGFYLVILSIILSPIGVNLWAQVDPSTTLLLRSSGQSESSDEELDSSRYTIRPSSKSSGEVPQTSRSLPAQTQPSQPEPAKVQSPEVVRSQEAGEYGAGDESPSASGEIQQADERPLAGSGYVSEYKQQLHPNDPRRNLVEVMIAPGFIYNDSASSYWYRSYSTAGPGLSLEARVWLTPFFGISSSYRTSFSHDMRGNPDGSRRLAADHQWFTAGFKFRKFFSVKKRSPYLSYGLEFKEYQLKVPTDDSYRVRLRVSGVNFNIQSHLPTSRTYTWLIGAELMPRAGHSEVATGVNVQSGTQNETMAVGFWLGGEFLFNRKNQIFWKLSHSVQKSIYDGQSSPADPITGATPEGVSVTNGFSLFEFGYRWGD